MHPPEPGSGSYFPNLLAYIDKSPGLNGWKLDPSLFSALLLCLVVKRGGLIVDVPEESGSGSGSGSGIGSGGHRAIAEVVGSIMAMTRGVFGLSTIHAHLTVDTTPESIPYHFVHHHHHHQHLHSHHHQYGSSSHARRSVPRRSKSTATSRYVSAASTPGLMYPSAGMRTPTPKASQFLYSPPVESPEELTTTTSTNEGNDHPAAVDHSEESFDPHIPTILVLTGLQDTNSPAMIKLGDILVKKVVEFGEDGVKRALPDGFLVIWVRDERGDVSGYMLDQFAASTTVYASDLNLPPDNLEQQSLITPDYIESLSSLLPYTHVHPPLQINMSNLLSAITAHPKLRSTITAKTVLLFPQFVRAHRLLSAPFVLPIGWQEGLRKVKGIEGGSEERFGVGGGKGGVDTWARKAGEEPDVNELSFHGWQGEGGGDADGGTHGEDGWYAKPENVHGVWMLCMRHRVKIRRHEGEVMWLLETSAIGLGQASQDQAQKNDRRNKRREEADTILEKTIETV